jgi:hypothetical protein
MSLTYHSKQTVPVSHCSKGMVLGINPQDKFAAFLANAEAQGSSKTTPTGQPIIKGRRRAASWVA